MVWTGPVGQREVPGGREMIPPPLAVRPEFTDDDVRWLNAQMQLTGKPPVRYAREMPPPPPPPWGLWMQTESIR